LRDILGWERQSKTGTKPLPGPASAFGEITGVEENPTARPDLLPSEMYQRSRKSFWERYRWMIISLR